MKDSDVQRIHRMKVYCSKIGESIKRYGDSFDVFSNDWDYYNSVSMSIMQIGEISVGLSAEFKEQTRTQMAWGLVRSMRNMFAHEYASMDKTIIWETATKDIPTLLNFCERVIAKNASETKKSVNRSDRDSR
jgi:uncharacterized protein with HEPN domain